MQEAADLAAALAAVRAAAPRTKTATDAELLADAAAVEAVGRVVDAWRVAAAAELELLVTSEDGEPLHLGRTRRRFSLAQRKALLARAGGRCEYGRCRTPAPYLDAHHVDWYQRDGGGTDIDNGIMLCSYHHHLIHAAGTPVEIRRHDGGLFIVPKRWTGPPDLLQRVGRGVHDEPGLADFLRRHDPDTHPWVR